MTASERPRQRAVVLGGSMAGLLATRVLSDHVERVTLLDADELPAEVVQRRGVPQGRHAHGLLTSGLQVMEALYPGLTDELVAQGAQGGDVADDVIWCLAGSYKARFTCGLPGLVLSRPLLETTIRRRTLALPNVDARTGVRAAGLLVDETGVTGVRLEGATLPETLPADLVVDATGRGSRMPAWLEAHGFSRPVEDTVEVGVGYTTRVFRRRPEDVGGRHGVICGIDPPHCHRFGVALRMEGERWMVTLGGFLGDHTPADDEGFLAFAASLASPDLHDLLRTAEPLGDYVTHKFPSNRRRRYERLDEFPEGLLVVGDGLCSFNPIYGQGMSVAALEAQALQACLAEPAEGDPLWRRFFERAAHIVDGVWTLTTSADLTVEGVEGRKPPGFGLVSWYLGRVQNVAARDHEVCRAFFRVTNLLASPSSLFAPPIALRVLRPGAGRRPPMRRSAA